MVTTPIFTAGGLASGLDTNTIVDKLVALESQPITKNSARQAALNVQISSIGDLLSKIKALSSTATTLAGGVAANSVISSPAGISAVAGTGALPGTYSIKVTSVATAAKARSTGVFASASAPVAAGTITLTVQDAPVPVTLNIAAGSDLSSAARQINQAGKPVRAAVISDGTNFYLSLTNRNTGKPIGVGTTGMTVVSDTTGLGLAVTKDATNAMLEIDDLPVESLTNEISTAISGVTITAKAEQLTKSDLVIGGDSAKSTSNLQAFVDAYNGIVGILQKSLRPDPSSPPVDGSTLDGSTVLTLQHKLHGLLSSQVVATASVRTLADIGVKLLNDGTVQIDSSTLNNALAKDPDAVNAVFSTAVTGMAVQVQALSTSFTDPVNGQLIQRQKSITKTIKDLATSNTRLQDHVANYKLQLQRQFATMEQLIANFNSIGTFLSNSAAAAANGRK